MKKVFTSLFLLMLGVMATYATDYGLKVAGVSVTSTGSVSAGQSEGTIYWDGSTLTFTNVSLTTSENVVNYIGMNSITLEFQGNNTVTSTGTTVLFSYHANMTIRGRLNTGDRATVKYTGSETGKLGIYVRDGKNLNIYDLYLTVSSKNSGIVAETGDSYASKLTVTTAVLDISTTTSGSAAVRGFSSASFDSSDAYLTDGRYYDTTNKRIVNSDGTVASVVKTDAPLYVGGAIVGIGYSNEKTVTPAGVTEGTIKYNHNNKTLTFNAVKMTTEVAGDLMNVVWNKNLDGLNIQFNGMNTLALSTNARGSVIKTEKKTTIKGEGVDITKLTTLSGNIGIYGPNGEVIIDNASVFANGNYGVIGTSGSTLNMTVKNSWLAAKGTEGSIQNVENCVLDGVQPATDIAAGVCYRKSLKGFGTATEIYKDAIWILPWSEDYNVSVLGTKITDLNRNGIAVDGLTGGTIAFDKDSKTLTLDGVTMTAPEGNTFVGIDGGSGAVEKVSLLNNNEITTNGNAFQFYGDITFEGDGKLIATSSENNGISMYKYNNSASITIDVNNTVKFFGKKRGVWGDVGSTTTSNLVLKKAGTSSDYYFKGETTGAINGFTDLLLTNMDFYNSSNYGTPGSYFDNNSVRQNGGSIIKGDNVVNFYRLNDGDRYGIKIAGTEITACNMYGVGSKYITSGGGEAVTYSGGTLTLTNATIASNDNAAVYNSDTGIEGLIVNVVGDNKLSATNDVFSFVLCKTATVTGSGTLTCNEFNAGKNSNITFKNIDFTALNQIHSNQAGAKITFNLTTAGKRIKAADGVYGFNNITLANGTKIVEPEGAKVNDAGTMIVTASGSRASNVVIGDASATGIEGVIMNPDAEVTGVFDGEGRQLNEMQPGVNIVRMSDGTTRKVIKK